MFRTERIGPRAITPGRAATGPAGGPAASAPDAAEFASLLTEPATGPAAGPATGPANAAGAALPISLALGLPDPAITAARDRAARRHGRAMLEALGGLQLALLGGDAGAAHSHLASLANQVAEAEDPLLCLILREINIRAAVELARPLPAA